MRHESNSILDLFNLTTSDATIMSQNRAISKLIEILISFECLSENKRYLYFDKSNDLRETKYNKHASLSNISDSRIRHV